MINDFDFPYFPDGEFGKALRKILSANIIKYRNRSILIDMDKGYLVGNNWYPTEEEAKAAVDQNYIALENFIKKPQINVSIVHKDGSETQLTEDQVNGYYEGRSPFKSYKMGKA